MLISLVSSYKATKEESVRKLEDVCDNPPETLLSENNAYLLPFLVGTHYMTVLQNDVKAIKYLKISLDWQFTTKNMYQLVYLYETRLRKSFDSQDGKGDKRKVTDDEVKELREMCALYQTAGITGNDGRSMHQLARFFIDKSDTRVSLSQQQQRF